MPPQRSLSRSSSSARARCPEAAAFLFVIVLMWRGPADSAPDEDGGARGPVSRRREAGEGARVPGPGAQRDGDLQVGAGVDEAQALRPLVVSEDGAALSKSALNSAWRRSMAAAIEAGVIDKDSRFGLHGLKHRGVTDTGGGKAKKKEASGHKTDAMLNLYDHEIPTVQPAGKRD